MVYCTECIATAPPPLQKQNKNNNPKTRMVIPLVGYMFWCQMVGFVIKTCWQWQNLHSSCFLFCIKLSEVSLYPALTKLKKEIMKVCMCINTHTHSHAALGGNESLNCIFIYPYCCDVMFMPVMFLYLPKALPYMMLRVASIELCLIILRSWLWYDCCFGNGVTLLHCPHWLGLPLHVPLLCCWVAMGTMPSRLGLKK